MPKSWDDVSFQQENRVKIPELIKVVDYRQNTKFKTYRFFGDLFPFAVQWLPIYKDGKPAMNQKGNAVRVPFNVTNFDPETGEYDSKRPCPFVAAAEKMMEYIDDDKERGQLKPSTGFYGQAINRKLQDNPEDGKPTKTERSTGFKESLDSEAFTPVEVHQINYTVGQGLETAKELNTVKKNGEKVTKSIADAKYGCDIQIKYDGNAKGQGKYKVAKADRAPLTEEEEKYLTWDVLGAIKQTTISRKEAKVEAERILNEFLKAFKKKGKKSNDSPDMDDVPEDIEEELSSKKKKKKPVDDDNDSPSPNIDDDEDEEDVKPAKKNKSKKKETPEDDDDTPVVKKKSKKAETPEDDDEEETPKPKKKKKPSIEEDETPVVKKKSKKKPVEDDDEDEEDEINLDDLEDDD